MLFTATPMCTSQQEPVVSVPNMPAPITLPCLEHWNVIMRQEGTDVNFNQGWAAYTSGFGNFLSDFWLGNQVLFFVTSTVKVFLRIDMWAEDGTFGAAEFRQMIVNSESQGYSLELEDFLGGSAGDGGMISLHNDVSFTTYDR